MPNSNEATKVDNEITGGRVSSETKLSQVGLLATATKAFNVGTIQRERGRKFQTVALEEEKKHL